MDFSLVTRVVEAVLNHDLTVKPALRTRFFNIRTIELRPHYTHPTDGQILNLYFNDHLACSFKF